MSDRKPVFMTGNCAHCNGRWHLTEYCPYQGETDLITLTDFGEALAPYPGSDLADDRTLGLCIATHHVCRGFVDLKEVSINHNAIVCRACSLRIVIPAGVETFGDLRAWRASKSNERDSQRP